MSVWTPRHLVSATLLQNIWLCTDQICCHNGVFHPLLHSGILGACKQYQRPAVSVLGWIWTKSLLLGSILDTTPPPTPTPKQTKVGIPKTRTRTKSDHIFESNSFNLNQPPASNNCPPMRTRGLTGHISYQYYFRLCVININFKVVLHL